MVMTAPQRPGWRRGPSATWSRLKPTQADVLEQYGLPSKGETRLNNNKAQEAFYDKIVERYMKFCAAAGTGEELDRRFAALSLGGESKVGVGAGAGAGIAAETGTAAAKSKASTTVASRVGQASQSPTTAEKTATSAAAAATPPTTSTSTSTPRPPSTTSTNTKTTSAELSLILSAMRKLRESIVATRRHDTFAQRAYICIIHAGLLANHMESYHPALLYLLHHIHRHNPLPTTDLHEFTSYRILDLACRQSDLAAAYAARAHHNHRDRRVDAVLKALAHDNWVAFWRVRRQVDGYQKRLVDWACDGVRLQALKCLGRGYLVVEKAYVERCAGRRRWEDLVKLDGVGWELVDGTKGEGDGAIRGTAGMEKVVIRRPKVK